MFLRRLVHQSLATTFEVATISTLIVLAVGLTAYRKLSESFGGRP